MQANKLVRPVFVREQRERRRMWRMCGKVTSSFCAARYGVQVEAVVSGPFSRSVIWGEPDSSRQNRKGRQQLLENAQRPDFNLRASQSALPVEHSVTPSRSSDHTPPVHCCTTAASHRKSNGRSDSYNMQSKLHTNFFSHTAAAH